MPDRIDDPLSADARPRTLVVHHRSGIGDLVWHVPYLRAIAATSRRGRVVLLAPSTCRAADLLHADTAIEEVIQYDYRRRAGRSDAAPDGGLRGFWSMARRLRSGRFDRIFIFSSRVRYGVLARCAGIPQRAGFGFSWFERLWLNCGPAIERYTGTGSWVYPEATAFARAHGFVEGPVVPRVAVADDLDAEFARRLASLPRPRVALAIGTSTRSKDWGESNFCALAQHLLRRRAGVILVGGPAECAAAQRITDTTGRMTAVQILCQRSVALTAAALKHCDFCVGNDTGALNLAAAVGVRALGLFGETRPLRHDPSIEAIEAQSMQAIDVEAVVRRLGELGVCA